MAGDRHFNPPCACPGTPRAGDPNSWQGPNPITFVANTWQELPHAHGPQTIVPLAPVNGVLWISPGRRGDATSDATLAATAYPSWYTVAPGVYYAYWKPVVEANLQAAIFPRSYSGAVQPPTYVRATHSQVTLNGGAAANVLAANALRQFALIQNNGSTSVRLTWGGTDPTTSTGIRLEAGSSIAFEGPQLHRALIRGIEESGAPVLDIVEGV